MGRWLRAAMLGALLTAPLGFAWAGPADGTFKGRYVCSAGPGGVTLSITSNAKNQLTAVLRFYSLPQNPKIPSGSYRLKGRFVPKTGQIVLNRAGWIVQPPGYTMVNVRAVLSKDGKSLSGKLTGASGCKSITAKRQGKK